MLAWVELNTQLHPFHTHILQNALSDWRYMRVTFIPYMINLPQRPQVIVNLIAVRDSKSQLQLTFQISSTSDFAQG